MIQSASDPASSNARDPHKNPRQSDTTSDEDPRAASTSLGGTTLGACFSILQRRRRTILIVFLIVSGLAALGALLAKPEYSASTSMIVTVGREFAFRPEAGAGSAPRFSLEQMINSEIEILESRSLAAEVVDAVGLESLYPELQEDADASREQAHAKAVSKLCDAISAKVIPESSVIRVSMRHDDPEIAAKTLNTLTERFREKHVEVFSGADATFVEARLEKARERLARSEAAMVAFRKEHGAFEIEAQRRSFIDQRTALETDLTTTQLRIGELQYSRRRLGENPDEPVPTDGRGSDVGPEGDEQEGDEQGTASPSPTESPMDTPRELLLEALGQAEFDILEATQAIESATPLSAARGSRFAQEAQLRLLDLRLKERTLLDSFDADTRQVRNVQEEIAIVERFLAGRGPQGKGNVDSGPSYVLATAQSRQRAIREKLRQLDLAAVHTELVGLRARESMLQERLRGSAAALQELDGTEFAMRDLQRKVDADTASYIKYQQRLQEARETQALDEEKLLSVRVFEKADPPIEPTGLSRPRRLGLGLGVGLLAALAFAFGVELLPRLRSRE